MKRVDEPTGKNRALREQTSSLSAAVLRVTASMDLDTVLREAVDSARMLTNARYGIIAAVDETGKIQDFVYSGFPPEVSRQLFAWPDGPRLFEHFRDLPGAIRLNDLPAYVRSLGLSSDLMLARTFQGTPLRHQGVHVGNFFLGGKEAGHEFTVEDEEILVLFACQAATAIANARAHRDEQRARADLEALVDISPVGVVVLDARTGRPNSFNREAIRIVENLRVPGHPPEQLLEVITCRRADGREIAFGAFPMDRRFSDAETLSAEEVLLSVPDGRSVRTLINAAPIGTKTGEIDSLVVTMQDLAPLEELERQRAEFVEMVTHELREPLTSIKGSTTTVLGASPALDPAEIREYIRIIDDQADHMRGLISDLLDAGRIEAGTLSVAPEPTELAALVDQARNTFLSGGARHAILIDLPPDLPKVMADRRRIVQVLNNLFSNAARHAPESTPIRVAAEHDGVHVSVSVSDEGRGVPPERLPHLFRKHAGSAEPDGEARGHGLGLAICKGLVEAHGGRIWAESAGAGKGTRFAFTVPVEQDAGGASAVSDRARQGPRRKAADPIRILVLDDNPKTLRFVRDALSGAGYAPLVAGDHRNLARIIRTEKPRLVLLDLMLPGTNGIELMEQIPELSDLPVIFISGYGRAETIAMALETGAADYIVKPFSATELTARVRAALRRREEPTPFVVEELAIDYVQRQVTVAGRPVELTATEFELLRVLSLNAGRVVTYDTLLRQVWDGRDHANAELVRTFIKKVRKKLGDDASRPAYIFTARGVGYRMARHGRARDPEPTMNHPPRRPSGST